jgi:hypothetical protein
MAGVSRIGARLLRGIPLSRHDQADVDREPERWLASLRDSHGPLDWRRSGWVDWYELYNFDNNSGFYMGLYSSPGVDNAGRAAAMTSAISSNPT